jgi:hypothetical protein
VSNGAGPGDPANMGEESVGSVGDEAAKLFGALADWARDVGDHVDTGAAECTYCPICRTVHVIRQASPEVRDHLAVAATSLMQAAAGVLAATARAGATPTDGMEHIDLDADPGEWPEEEDR